MDYPRRIAIFVLAALTIGLFATLFASQVSAQQEGWQIVRADYGFRNQRNDVTDILTDLIERGGVNGKVAVNNQTMGGDPAIGTDKTLRIFARTRNIDGSFIEREFTYREDSFVEARQFIVRHANPADHPAMTNDRGRDRDRDRLRDGDQDRSREADDWNGIRILRAFYGIQGKTVNVTELLRTRLREGRANIVVTNNAFGGDPAVGSDKVLIVVYSYQGKETAVAVHEGDMLALP
jgi:hypothetical protein